MLGTTNLDQFATGLVGTRSPVRRGARRRRPGAHLAAAPARARRWRWRSGIVDLALGTDTAGSGRVPAAFNGIVGLKPTRGLVPTDGRRPGLREPRLRDACSPATLPEAERRSRSTCLAGPAPRPRRARPGPWRVAVPPRTSSARWTRAGRRRSRPPSRGYAAAGAEVRHCGPLARSWRRRDCCTSGAFVAERYTAVGEFIEGARPDADLDPTVAGIITGGPGHPGAPAVRRPATAWPRLRSRGPGRAGRRRRAAAADHARATRRSPRWPRTRSGANARLGRFTNSTNLFDLAAVAVPAGTVAGRPFGVMLIGPAFTDDRLAADRRPAPAGDRGSRWSAPT